MIDHGVSAVRVGEERMPRGCDPLDTERVPQPWRIRVLKDHGNGQYDVQTPEGVRKWLKQTILRRFPVVCP